MCIDLGCPLKPVGGEALMREREDSKFLICDSSFSEQDHMSTQCFVILYQSQNSREVHIHSLYITSNKVRQLAIVKMLELTCRFVVDGITEVGSQRETYRQGSRGGFGVGRVQRWAHSVGSQSSGLPLGA